MKSTSSLANRYNLMALPFVGGATLWLAVGVPYRLLWLFGLLLVIGGLLAWRGKKLHDADTQQRGEAYLERLKENRPD